MKSIFYFTILSSLFSIPGTYAAVSMDRTRVIFDGQNKSIVINITNNNQRLPYLAQGWLEDSKEVKVNTPLVVLPPVQRLEPGKSSQIKIEALPAAKSLPQDRESLYYFNMREIPPKSDKPNTLQIALQTKVKLFYRPEAITPHKDSPPWQEKMEILKEGANVIIKNPTPYFITIINAANNINADAKNFKPVMIAPFSESSLGVSSEQLGQRPVLTYINDFGGRPKLTFICKHDSCSYTNEVKN